GAHARGALVVRRRLFVDPRDRRDRAGRGGAPGGDDRPRLPAGKAAARVRRGVLVAVVVAAALAAPASAWAHAALLHTTPAASVALNRPPKQVAMTYSEAVEPRFAVVSITDAAG